MRRQKNGLRKSAIQYEGFKAGKGSLAASVVRRTRINVSWARVDVEIGKKRTHPYLATTRRALVGDDSAKCGGRVRLLRAQAINSRKPEEQKSQKTRTLTCVCGQR